MYRKLSSLLVSIMLVLPVAGYSQVCNTTTLVASTPDSRFIDNRDGTITDKQTGLHWMKCALGQVWDGTVNTCNGPTANFLWWEAFAAAEVINGVFFAGKTSWRVPNVKELASLIESQCYQPSINVALFPNTVDDGFWSSSPYLVDASIAWLVAFEEGYIFRDNKNDSFPVRLVSGDN